MKIILDAMGGDNAPHEIVKGAVQALNKYNDFELILTGKSDIMEEELKKYAYPGQRLRIVHASQVIETAEPPVEAIKRKKDSSMVAGMNILAQGGGDVFITAGSTGATVAGSMLVVRRIRGVKRPALAPVLPTAMDKGVLLIDCGANVDCKPSYLAQFGVMGSIYMKNVFGVESPRIGLLNNGAESEKGNLLTKAAYEHLLKAPVNFYGNIEAREVTSGVVDVVVCDGFVGNAVLKMMEGTAETLVKMLKAELMGSFRSKIGAALAKNAFKNFKKRMDYSDYGGALLLGVNGGVIKAHGSSDAKTIVSTIRQARDFHTGHVVDVIKEEISKVNFEDETV